MCEKREMREERELRRIKECGEIRTGEKHDEGERK